MLAYMNKTSLLLSLETGETHFWSRSRQKLWKKGETSGHIQKVKNIFIDCDQDTFLIEVEQIKVACHTGEKSCFYREIRSDGQVVKRSNAVTEENRLQRSVLENLSQTIINKKQHPNEKSYTSQLFKGGIDRILKKIAEEAGELIIASKNSDPEEVIHETSDLLYHLLVVLAYYDIPLKAIDAELGRRTGRSGLEEKASRGRNKQEAVVLESQ